MNILKKILILAFICAPSIAEDLSNVQGLDVRSSLELKINPAPGATHIPLSDLEEKATSLDKERPIYIFCEAGGRANRGKELLKKLGFKSVKNIGDWRTWNKMKNAQEKKTVE